MDKYVYIYIYIRGSHPNQHLNHIEPALEFFAWTIQADKSTLEPFSFKQAIGDVPLPIGMLPLPGYQSPPRWHYIYFLRCGIDINKPENLPRLHRGRRICASCFCISNMQKDFLFFWGTLFPIHPKCSFFKIGSFFQTFSNKNLHKQQDGPVISYK